MEDLTLNLNKSEKCFNLMISSINIRLKVSLDKLRFI